MLRFILLFIFPISLFSQIDQSAVSMKIISAELMSYDHSQLVFEVEFKNNSKDTVLLFRTARKHAYKNKWRFQTIGFLEDVFTISLLANECAWEEKLVFDDRSISYSQSGPIEKSYLTLGSGYEEIKLLPGAAQTMRYERTLSEPICPKTTLKLSYNTSAFAERQNFKNLDDLKKFYDQEQKTMKDKITEIKAIEEKNDYTNMALDHLESLQKYASKSTQLFNNYYKAIVRITPLKMESNELGITKK